MKKGAGYHHGDLRRALVEATLRLVAEHGPDRFTLRAAAQLAGVSDGAPYHHFADREALLASAAAEGHRALCAEMERAAAEHVDTRSRCRAVAVRYVLFAARSPSRFRLMFGSLLDELDRHRELSRALQGSRAIVRRTFEAGFGEAGGGHPLSAWALVHGLSLLAVDGHLGSEARSARRLERLVLEAWEAIDPPAPESGARRSTEPPRSGRRAHGGRERLAEAASRR